MDLRLAKITFLKYSLLEESRFRIKQLNKAKKLLENISADHAAIPALESNIEAHEIALTAIRRDIEDL